MYPPPISQNTLSTRFAARLLTLLLLCLLVSLPDSARAQQVQSLQLTPNSLVGGAISQAKVILNQNAPTGGTLVTLASDNTAAAYLVAQVTVPAGTNQVLTSVFTNSVTTSTTVQITATTGMTNVSANLTVSPGSASTHTPTADAYVNSGSGGSPPNWDNNFGTSALLAVKKDQAGSTSNANRAAYLKFDLTNVTVAPVSAILRITQTQHANNGPMTLYCYGVADTSWSETSITWNNAPGLNRTNYTSTGTLAAQQSVLYVTQPTQVGFDVTSYIASHIGQQVTLQIVGQEISSLSAALSSRESSYTPTLVLTYAAPALTADAISSSQINLTWTDPITTRDEYLIERKTGAGGTWTEIATVESDVFGYEDAALTGNITYYYRVRGRTGSAYSAYSNEANDITYAGSAITGWGYLAAYPTGATSIRVYWQPLANISQIKVFRATSSGTYNFSQPLATLSGTAVTYDDSGLTAGQEYFYVVKATTTGGASADTQEDSAITSADAIPWNGTASQIVSQAYQRAKALITDGADFDIGTLRVMAPDGKIYIYGSSTALPPDGIIDVANGTVTSSGITSPMGLWEPKQAAAGQDGLGGGGIRRVVSKMRTTNGNRIVGVSGRFFLQDGLNTVQVPQSGAGVGQVSPHCYIGVYDRNPGVMIDAGINYERAQPSLSLPNRWRVFLRISDGRPEHGYTQLDTRFAGRHSGNNYIPADTSAYGFGKIVAMRLVIDIPGRTAGFFAAGADTLGTFSQELYMVAFNSSSLSPNRGYARPRMKRVISCDQKPAYYQAASNRRNFEPPAGGFRGLHQGAVLDNSYLKNVIWDLGQLRLDTGAWITWSNSLIDRDGGDSLNDNYYNYRSEYVDPFSGPITLTPVPSYPEDEEIDIIH